MNNANMPADLNSLLRWAVENSTPAEGATDASSAAGQQQGGEGMQLTFKPAQPGQQPSTGNQATLHPDDPQFPSASAGTVAAPAGGAAAAPAAGNNPRSDLSTEMLDLIMGKPDSAKMKEKMAIATNTSADVDERVQALDDFEMLIELIDNANNMPVLKLWQPLIELFDDPNPEVARHALWVAGTAIQNNLKGQAAFFVFGGFPKVLDKIAPAHGEMPATATRAKAVYTLSQALKHWPLAGVALNENNDRGYDVLRQGVQDTDVTVRRKMCFLLGTLVNQARDKFDGSDMPSEVRSVLEERAKESGGKDEDLLAGLSRTGVFAATISALARDAKVDDADVDFEENAIRALARAAEYGALTPDEKAAALDIWTAWTPVGHARRDLPDAESQEIEKALTS